MAASKIQSKFPKASFNKQPPPKEQIILNGPKKVKISMPKTKQLNRSKPNPGVKIKHNDIGNENIGVNKLDIHSRIAVVKSNIVHHSKTVKTPIKSKYISKTKPKQIINKILTNVQAAEKGIPKSRKGFPHVKIKTVPKITKSFLKHKSIPLTKNIVSKFEIPTTSHNMKLIPKQNKNSLKNRFHENNNIPCKQVYTQNCLKMNVKKSIDNNMVNQPNQVIYSKSKYVKHTLKLVNPIPRMHQKQRNSMKVTQMFPKSKPSKPFIHKAKTSLKVQEKRNTPPKKANIALLMKAQLLQQAEKVIPKTKVIKVKGESMTSVIEVMMHGFQFVVSSFIV